MLNYQNVYTKDKTITIIDNKKKRNIVKNHLYKTN